MPKRISATDAKNRFGDVLKMAETEPVYIVKHGRPQTVVVSASGYDALTKKAGDPDDRALHDARLAFDAMVAAMQTPRSRKAIDRLLSASADELNAAAAKGMRSRGARR